jgi:hypothetical protein
MELHQQQQPGRDRKGRPELIEPSKNAGPPRLGWRVDEWSKRTGTSHPTTYRRVRDGTLKTIRYGGVLLIVGLADRAAE